MNFQLIKGEFSANDAMDIITQMIHIKIKYHENKIHDLSNEEDIKRRESKIKQLQKDLYEIRKLIESKSNKIKMTGTIEIE